MAQRRNTHQRELVKEAVGALGVHPTAAQVYEYVHCRDKKVSLATVYRNLNLLAEEGDILAIETSAGRHYDYRTDDHEHMVCVQCGAMMDVTVPYDASLDQAASEATGFAAVRHRIFFEGVCPDCARSAEG
ncbi:Peroxide operon regulator [Slackia heliotrinireducens]|uniref:Fe2+/Zn2+ uptake regulation protein n=1 Tax=Slackia heliotrinireducens (strain ATCC 29202 / DSM 20476 / NCTC 11029 / RHS 1) TaxID=471855 RepID=C7N2K7_SLAHD|nr:transcriptional repressor [Slackia heliotrinireducens]ACV23515.1 Fe2+/Zn2+ uptake regulation protein [Slackia heliotrinireducens DSM 20476]VEH02896.1 Peroxide operon regulator [Slackia heliotrinireducens]